MKKLILTAFAIGIATALQPAAHAQFGSGIVYDPTQSAHGGEIVAPILYAWTEPNACAGHAVLIFPGSPCLQCGFSVSGDCKLQVTDWPGEKKLQTEPARGAVFQPYGPIELLGTISVAASLALDALLEELGPQNIASGQDRSRRSQTPAASGRKNG